MFKRNWSIYGQVKSQRAKGNENTQYIWYFGEIALAAIYEVFVQDKFGADINNCQLLRLMYV